MAPSTSRTRTHDRRSLASHDPGCHRRIRHGLLPRVARTAAGARETGGFGAEAARGEGLLLCGYAGERVTHAIMGILYAAMVANLVPVLARCGALPTALVVEWVDIPGLLRWGLFVMAAGVFLSGLRDLYA